MEEKFYKSVIDSASVAYSCHEIVYNKKGEPADYRIIDTNRSFVSFFGIGSADINGRKVSELKDIPEESRAELLDLYESCSENNATGQFEFFSDSLKRWYNVQVIINNRLFTTLSTDITRLKSLQTELENTGYLLVENERLVEMSTSVTESELSYKSLFDTSILAIYVLDENGVLIDVNAATTLMYGYEKNEMVGLTAEHLSAPGHNNTEVIHRHIINAFRGEPQRLEWWGIRKNGEVFPKDIVLNKGVYFGRDVVFAMARDNTELSHTLEALRESEDKYRTLTEQLPVGVYRTTVDGQIVYTNYALVKILGYDSLAEFLELNVNQLYAVPGNRQEQLSNAKSRSGVIKSEFQLKKKTGDLIWVKDNSRLLFDKNGNPEYFDGILEDITEKKNSELAFKKNQANLKAIIENTLENIWSINLNFEVQYVNEVFASAFYNTFGKHLSPGVNIIEALPDKIKMLWKERYSRAFQNEHFLFEDKIDINNASIYVEVAMNPILIDGKVVGVSAYGRDVTEKRLAEIQLQYQADLRKLLIELSSRFINLPLKEINSAISQSLIKIGEFAGADRAYVFNYNFDEYTATNTFEWVREGIEPQITNLQDIPLDPFKDVVEFHKRGEVVNVDNCLDLVECGLKKLLTGHDVISMLSIPLIKEGSCIGFVGFDSVREMHLYNDYEKQLLQVYAQTLVNVIERLEKEQKLIAAKEKAEESDRLKSAFLANMSHEIRTPMSGIIGFLNLLNEPDLSEENKNAYINIVTQSGLRLLDTINDIIELSKIESGGLQVKIGPVNLSELMGYYTGFFRHQTNQKGLEFIVANNVPDNIRMFQTDKRKLDSIISNLIKNAIKFTNSGSVEFGCSFEKDKLLFWVKDTGVGIPEDRLNFIFDRFVQGDISSSRPHEGSGLGLAIAKAYIEMLNGKITVQSIVGKGTRFSFEIPYLPVEERISLSQSVQNVVNNEVRGSTILIAEDDYASYLFIQRALSGQGINFLRAMNGEDAVKMVKDNPEISVILMDIKMPGMTGLEAARRIREFNNSIPIIAQTAYSLSGDRELAIEAGCNDYISKPINRKELQTLIKKYAGVSQ